MSNRSWPPLPPKNESEAEKAARLTAEKEAKRISDEIDRALEQERQELRKRRPQTRILLLGMLPFFRQAESGKSTMIKNFQLYFCPSSFHAETEAWRAVIHLNLARFVNYLLYVLSNTNTGPTRDYRMFQMRLSPLKQVELIVTRCLSAESSPIATPTEDKPVLRSESATEVSIRGGTGWKSFLRRRRGSQSKVLANVDDLEDARRILDACKEDIVALWKSPAIRALEQEGVDLHHHARYFVEHADRVADIKYTPTTDDILRARLRTVGVEEYRMTMETAAEKGAEWVFYDVGGQRSQRASWASYFEDVNAMMFLCPMSGFNQRLSEDKSVNRLYDSMELWETVCRNKLLGKATFILLLNKADLLRSKLKAGVQFSDYIMNYDREQPNTVEEVSNYIRKEMTDVHRVYSPRKRQLHVHLTCAIVRDCSMSACLQGN
ncbi:G-protein alpha subunit [Trametes versicolor FP-101664 SS1]|uniref:G-protein alpha subunit n=1 Tax=Trametes versicolor (strain FP-101664) TaxID=717944 RepID=UPI0004622D98|nr:G-protein alpha subunit [Trametes versicolor FP-101664 SS1]EIW63048.1 G-protein alpha subunit [Trametes versicolor FP-101664 SS1]